MYKEKCVKIQNSREIRESLIKIHYLWKTNTHRHAHTLWFAFILVSLNHWKQWKEFRPSCRNCCDLLSFSYLWTIGNSPYHQGRYPLLVVICFHFSIFEPLETVFLLYDTSFVLLWFAFILVSLNHWKQYFNVTFKLAGSCDLLSF